MKIAMIFDLTIKLKLARIFGVKIMVNIDWMIA